MNNNIAFILLAFLITCGETAQQNTILTSIKAFFFEEPCFGAIFHAAEELYLEQADINLMSVNDKIVTDHNQKALKNRLNLFRDYFDRTGQIRKRDPDDIVKRQIAVLLAEISSKLNYNTPLDVIIKDFTVQYVARAKNALFDTYREQLSTCPSEDFTQHLFQQMKDLDRYLYSGTWLKYVCDPKVIENEPEEIPLILRKGKGVFYRGNIYLITGFAGCLKSYFSLTLAGAALNQGTGADRTLSFYSNADRPLRVLFADTELARNTVKKRLRSFMTMSPNYDPDCFRYLSLRLVSGSLETKMQVFDEACGQFKPDLIFLDSGRDLCHDYNDVRETDTIINHFRQIATDLNAVLVTTSHKALAGGNAKGHFGMRASEACGLEISLDLKKEGDLSYISATFPKQREDDYPTFSFRYDADRGLLAEYEPTVDKTVVRRQVRSAEEAVRKVLTPGRTLRYKELVYLLTSHEEGRPGVAKSTAKEYISILTGTVLVQIGSEGYRLADLDQEIPFDDDLPAG